MCVCVFVRTHARSCTWIYVSMLMYTCMSVYLFVCIYIYIYTVLICVCIYIYTHTHKWLHAMPHCIRWNVCAHVYVHPGICKQPRIHEFGHVHMLKCMYKYAHTMTCANTHTSTLIFIMIAFFLAKKENIVVPNAVEKSRTGAFRSQDQMLSFFLRLKKKQSLWKWEYTCTNHCMSTHRYTCIKNSCTHTHVHMQLDKFVYYLLSTYTDNCTYAYTHDYHTCVQAYI